MHTALFLREVDEGRVPDLLQQVATACWRVALCLLQGGVFSNTMAEGINA